MKLHLIAFYNYVGMFSEHYAFLVELHLRLIDEHTRAIDELTTHIEEEMIPFQVARDLMVTIPGISTKVADVIIAETGADMSRFPTAGHLASWADTCPGSNESASRVKSTRTRLGNPYLKSALGTTAMAASSGKDTYLAAKNWRIASGRGSIKTVVALEHAMLVAVWNMLQSGETYSDLGSNYFTKRDPENAKDRALNQLRNLGYLLTIEAEADVA